MFSLQKGTLLLIILWSAAGATEEIADFPTNVSREQPPSLNVEKFYFEHDPQQQGSTKMVGVEVLFRQTNQFLTEQGRQLTIDQLHQLADQLTLTLRNMGYSFHTVYLPQQTVKKGEVKFTYRKAYLVDVNIIGASTIDREAFSAPFHRLIDQELYAPDINQKVYALRQQPGLTIFAFYSRGASPGEVRLNLKVERAKRFWYSSKIDNYGSSSSGQHRFVSDLNSTQWLSQFDQFSAVAALGLDGQQTHSFFAQYQYPFSDLESAIHAYLGKGLFELGEAFSHLELDGDSLNMGLDYLTFANHQAGFEREYQFGLYQRTSQSQSLILDQLDANEKSHALKLGLTWNHLWSSSGITLNHHVNLIGGKYSTEQAFSINQQDKFYKLDYFARVNWTDSAPSRWTPSSTWSVRGQYANQALPSIESTVLSGAYGVRALPSGSFAADSAILSRVNLDFPHLLANLGKSRWRHSPYMFYDWAQGKTFANADQYITRQTQGFGIGLYSRFWRLHSHLLWATTVGESAPEEKHSQLLWEVTWR